MHLNISVTRNAWFYVTEVEVLWCDSPGAKSVKDILFVKESVAGSFGEVFGKDVGSTGQVGYRAGNLYDSGAGTGRESHPVKDALEK